MIVAVIGGTGTVGRRVVAELLRRGHEVRQLSRTPPNELVPGVAHRPVDLSTGTGLHAALAGADALVNVANSLTHTNEVLVAGTRRVSEAAVAAGVGHHVLCSIVGIEDVPSSYYRAKIDQEQVVTHAETPWSIVRATQFHQLLDQLFSLTARGGLLPAPSFPLQPIDAQAVARVLADAVEAGPSAQRIEVAGPQVLPVRMLARSWRSATGRQALLVPLPLVGAWGRGLRRGALTAPDARLENSLTFEAWLSQRVARTSQPPGMPLIARLAASGSEFANKRGVYLGRRSTRLHVALYRRSGGKLTGHLPGWPQAPILLLDHTGAKSGVRRTSPLMYHQEGDIVAVVASKGGQPTHPAWFHNVRANPDTTIQIGSALRDVRARVATDEERERLWPKFVAFYPGYEFFQRNAKRRRIPVVILDPR